MKNLRFRSTFIAAVFLSTILTSCGEDEEVNEPPAQTQTTNSALPSTVASQVVNMVFTAAQAGAPYSLNQEVRVTFSSSGMLFLDNNPTANDGDEINVATFTKKGVEYVWTDAANDYSYALSLKTDSSINELNVSKSSTSAFLGSFKLVQAIDASLINQFSGTYTVTQTISGTHNRMSVTIDATGNIDFDSNVQISTTEFARVEDKLDCCDAVSVDTKPYPTTPYGRIILYTDTSNINLISIDYRPDHPAVTNRVEVKF